MPGQHQRRECPEINHKLEIQQPHIAGPMLMLHSTGANIPRIYSHLNRARNTGRSCRPAFPSPAHPSEGQALHLGIPRGRCTAFCNLPRRCHCDCLARSISVLEAAECRVAGKGVFRRLGIERYWAYCVFGMLSCS